MKLDYYLPKATLRSLARCIRKNGVANIQMEMGGGKTSIGSAVIELLDAYPALILLPPHLVPKWIRELEEVIPGRRAREMRRIGRGPEDPGDVNDVRYFLEDYRNGRIEKKVVAVVANTSAKIGPGWEPAVMKRKVKDPLLGEVVLAFKNPERSPILPGNLWALFWSMLSFAVSRMGKLLRVCGFWANRLYVWDKIEPAVVFG